MKLLCVNGTLGITDILFRKQAESGTIKKTRVSLIVCWGLQWSILKQCSSRACEGFELIALLDVRGAVRSRQRDFRLVDSTVYAA